MTLKHIVSVDQFDSNFISEIFNEANYYSNNNKIKKILKNKIIANLFYEPSTRTSSSFFSAIVKLGGTVLPINEVKYSSVMKGESLTDTIRTLNCYVDGIILRHNIKGSAKIAADVSDVPIINAGDGEGEHPTQALLDLFTIFKEKGFENISNLNIGLMGDLKYSRTIHSLVKLLRLYNPNLYFISPLEFQLSNDYISPNDFKYENLEDVIDKLDILYITRIQRERHENIAFDKQKEYKLSLDNLKHAKFDLLIMHPFPRVGEIPEIIDNDPRAIYFKQMKNGLLVRMALLKYLYA